jgi:chromosome segregation ATPase
LRTELDGLGTSLEDERQTAGAARSHAEDLERTLTGERARVAVLESDVKGARHELEQAAAARAAERETAERLQLDIEEVRKSLEEERAALVGVRQQHEEA